MSHFFCEAASAVTIKEVDLRAVIPAKFPSVSGGVKRVDVALSPRPECSSERDQTPRNSTLSIPRSTSRIFQFKMLKVADCHLLYGKESISRLKMETEVSSDR